MCGNGLHMSFGRYPALCGDWARVYKGECVLAVDLPCAATGQVFDEMTFAGS